ncbi:MAG TPA: sigma-70 family RNA polymerase sigma factor [Steroidobacteraceae bacterium]|jgi:RNA polymerase sigma factor (sigma-70 family)|nr:sigma-70 family RNA polymerase sigma factor [Steroidobacteraceae bacterium]
MPALHSVEISSEVLERARAGDTDAHAYLYRTLSKPVYTLLRRFVVRPAIAEELLQDVFVEILRNLNHYSGIGSFPGWVRSIAVNKALMYLRSPWHRSLSWLGADGIQSIHEESVAAIHDSFDSDLERALAALPAVSRAVVWLHDVEEMTHAEIARLFGRTASFSKSQLARAHRELRDRLETSSGGLACMPISRNC